MDTQDDDVEVQEPAVDPEHHMGDTARRPTPASPRQHMDIDEIHEQEDVVPRDELPSGPTEPQRNNIKGLWSISSKVVVFAVASQHQLSPAATAAVTVMPAPLRPKRRRRKATPETLRELQDRPKRHSKVNSPRT